MKKNHIASASPNSSRLEKVLLATGLVVVAVVGFFQMYEVQVFFSPEKYHLDELIIIREEFDKVDHNLRSLRVKLDNLKILCGVNGELAPQSPGVSSLGSPSSTSSHEVTSGHPPGWQEALQEVKKQRVSATRKLKYINAKINSMQRTLEKPLSANDQDAQLSMRQILRARTLAQIPEIRARCQIYEDVLRDLSVKSDKLAGCNDSQSIKQLVDH